jgi:hypothetical protein
MTSFCFTLNEFPNPFTLLFFFLSSTYNYAQQTINEVKIPLNIPLVLYFSETSPPQQPPTISNESLPQMCNVTNHINFASFLNSGLNLQFSMDLYMNVQYTDGPTIQLSTCSSEQISILASWKNYGFECELGLVNILRLKS